MQPLSNCSSNSLDNWKINTTITVVSLALIILGILNLKMIHFQGIGHIGSNVLLGTGAGIIILTVAISCLMTPKIKITKDFHHLNGEQAWNAATILTDDQVLFALINKDPVVYYIINSVITFSGDRLVIIDMQNQVKNKIKSIVPKEIVEKAIKVDVSLPAQTADQIQICRKSIRKSECFPAMQKRSEKTLPELQYLNSEGNVEKPSVEKTPIPMELLILRHVNAEKTKQL